MTRTGAPVLMLENPGVVGPQATAVPLPASLQEILDSFAEFDPQSSLWDLPDAGEGAAGHSEVPVKLIPLFREAHSA